MKQISNILFLIILLMIIGCVKPIIFSSIGGLKNESLNINKEIKYNNNYIDKALADSIELRWSNDTNGSMANTRVSVRGKYVFVPDLSGHIYCYDIKTGKILGVEKNNKGAIFSKPQLYRNRMFYMVNEFKEDYSVLYYYDYTSGKTITKNTFDGNCTNEMLIDEDGVYVVTDEGIIYKINFIGEISWTSEEYGYTSFVMAADEENVYLVTYDGVYIGLDKKTGEEKIKQNFGFKCESGLVIENGYGYLGNNNGDLLKIKMADANIVWKFNTKAKIKSTPVYNQDDVFIGNLNGTVYSINKMNGKINWQYETKGLVNTTPLLFSNTLVQPDVFKKVHLLDSKNGDVKKIINFRGRVKMSPVYSDSNIIFGIDKGELVVYKEL